MPSVFLRIFLGFWLTIGVLLATGVLLSYQLAEQRREAWQQFDPRAIHFEASATLARGGSAALADWLATEPGLPPGLTLFVIDEDGRELLGRELPRPLRSHLARLREHPRRNRSSMTVPPNFRPARPAPQLVGPDGHVYTMLLGRQPRGAVRFLPDIPMRVTLLLFALLTSAGVSWLLARTLSRPIERLREATHELAGGDMSARVGGPIAQRRDELGGLARDFNEMASRLEAARRSQQEMLRNVSHELRSPLARLKVALGLAQRDAGDHPALARIESESDRLDWLIGEIMDFARTDAAAPRREDFDLAAMLSALVRDARFEAGDAGPKIAFEAPDRVMVRGQRDALASAIENVLRNALHHADRRVALRLERTPDGLAVTVTDDGGGVPEEDLDVLFEPFYRGDKVGTAGLGLAIARRVAEAHAGSTTARNLPGGGLEVTISLPATILRDQRPS
ncbi:MAG: ATP-binding protein [Gammaproteobacteria bacterium]